MLFIPANSSSTGAFQLLAENDETGIIFETEGDTLSQNFKTDYGNYSDLLRKAFHHETTSYYRRTEREYVELNFPRLTLILSGTPKQLFNLIPDAENGLFSRFIFYYINTNTKWKNVFQKNSEVNLDEHYKNLGIELFSFYNLMLQKPEIHFELTEKQQFDFNSFFEKINDNYIKLIGDDYLATIRRLGLICYRFTMILSMLRVMQKKETSDKLVCEDRDLLIAFELITVLVEHSCKAFSNLNNNTKVNYKQPRERYYDTLPNEFDKKTANEIALSLKINEKTAERYTKFFLENNLLYKVKHNLYRKVNAKEIEDIRETEEI